MIIELTYNFFLSMPAITIQFSDNEANFIKQVAALNGTNHTILVKDIILNSIFDPVKETLLKHIHELESILFLARKIQNNEPLLWKDSDKFMCYVRSHSLNMGTDHVKVAELCQILQDRLYFLKCSLQDEEAISNVLDGDNSDDIYDDTCDF